VKLLLAPDVDELTVSHTKATVRIHLETQSGDTFLVELDEPALNYVIRHLLECSWLLKHYGEFPELEQARLPF
jgi:hypothetical protein